MEKLGKMTRITDLRSVWPHDANDFTKWLAEEDNLLQLGDTIGIELELEERESSVEISARYAYNEPEVGFAEFLLSFFVALLDPYGKITLFICS